MESLFIVVAGNPVTGFEVCGPFGSQADAEHAGPLAGESFGYGVHWWVLPLEPFYGTGPGPHNKSFAEWRERVAHGQAYVRVAISCDGTWSVQGPTNPRPGAEFLRLKTPAIPNHQNRPNVHVDAEGWPI